ncbi:GGDEF domain-containing protein [Novipirellula artificiosorum]|uniref:diguanylate cyclase n=1 Tax=Novipirellula artificiosorum TaxID=2528016 RepID=A0A5C6DZC2_9BACT|nr:GGDEF domain-containing protein [Novipirellula artificiosorum]TWU41978.1 putative diguanylate cyclase YdaM [Novipirellula artificiosorum]
MFLDLAIAFSCAAVGLCCGWVMHGVGWLLSSDEFAAGQTSRVTAELEQVKAEQERLSIVADRLRDYAQKMAIDVDEHQHNVKAVSDVLSSDQSLTADAMIEAVNDLIEANETMQTKLHSAQKRIHAQAEQLESAERRAQTDALTSVSNRGAFDEHLTRRHALGPGRAGTLMLLDVDKFKKFNDDYGHRAGDEVLKVVAQMLHARLKSYGIVARFGGEEFAAIIDGYTVDECKKIVESARVAISQHTIDFEGKMLRVTASIGVAETIDGESAAQWIERADAALYHSKDHGRDCGHWMNGICPERICLDDEDQASEPFLIPEVEDRGPDDAEMQKDGETRRNSSKASSVEEEVPQDKPKNAKSSFDDELKAKPSTDAEAAKAMSAQPETQSHPKTSGSKPKKGGAKPSAAPADRGAFAGLPGRAALAGAFCELQERSKAIGMSTQIMALRVNGQPAAGSMRTLLQIVRATLLSVDRIGADDANTLLVCIPGVDEEAALERAEQIRASADTVQFAEAADGSGSTLQIEVVQVAQTETFDEAMTRLADCFVSPVPASAG